MELVKRQQAISFTFGTQDAIGAGVLVEAAYMFFLRDGAIDANQSNAISTNRQEGFVLVSFVIPNDAPNGSQIEILARVVVDGISGAVTRVWRGVVTPATNSDLSSSIAGIPAATTTAVRANLEADHIDVSNVDRVSHLDEGALSDALFLEDGRVNLAAGSIQSIADTLRGSGTIRFNPRIQRPNGNPIEGASITIAGSQEVGRTNNDGRIAWGDNPNVGFLLPPGNHKARPYASGFQQIGEQDVNLVEDDDDTEYTLVPIPPIASSDPALARIDCDSRDFCDVPVEGLIFSFQISSSDYVVMDKAIDPKKPVEVTTKEDGKTFIEVRPSADLPGGATYLCTVKTADYNPETIAAFPIEVSLQGGNVFDLRA